jgi:hypothetical protein
MGMIGIDRDLMLVYEGQRAYGYGVWPSPVISFATIVRSDTDWRLLPHSTDLSPVKLVFREDVFDPVTKIRRGRFYQQPGTQPVDWHVHPHPAFVNEPGERDRNGFLAKRLFSFSQWPANENLRGSGSRSLVALGVVNAVSLWTVVDIERISNGEDLVTLRARSSFGILPEVNENAIPTGGRAHVLGSLSNVIEAAHRAGPTSVVDRCREAAQAMIGLYMVESLGNEKWRTEDLGPQVRGLTALGETKERRLILNAADSLARLHSRAKSNEQVRYQSRPVVEDDAECAISLVGLLLRELGWAAV